MNRYVGALGAATLVTILALWVVPPVGLVAAAVLLVLLPPWGRTLTERAVISAVVVMGAVAIVVPRAGSFPVTRASTLALLSVLLVGALALRAVPALRNVPIPRPNLGDLVVLVVLLLSGAWFVSAYVGAPSASILSGLFYTGWDNHAHFTTFANTYVAQSTTWPTIDGGTAWNQWYPALQTTLMAMADLVWHGEGTDRIGLLWPFVQWNAALFAASLAALVWVAGDIAARLGGWSRQTWTRPLAALLVGLFVLLGSPQQLYNRGFTNFVLGVAVVVVVAWLSARSWRSARTLGWFLLPLGVLAAVGLWTPLAIGLVPSGIVVAIALLKHRRWMGIVWLGAALVAGGFMVITQLQAILGADSETGTTTFAQNLGSIDVGMAPFNAGAALAAPVVAVLVAAILIARRRWVMALAIAGPILGFFLVAAAFMVAADAAGTSRLESYYVLKPLNGTLLAVAPLLAALLSVVVIRALDGFTVLVRALAAATAVAVVAGLFGYSGALPETGVEGLEASAGVRAGAERAAAVTNSDIGEAIVRSAEAARPFPQDVALMWDASGVLQNLWVESLHTTLSKDQQSFLLSLPSIPPEAASLAYIDLFLSMRPQTSVVILWFSPGSEAPLRAWAVRKDRVQLVRVPMPANAACPDCTGS